MLQRKVLEVREPEPVNRWALRQGLPEATCRELVNPGYADPFNCRTDITFDHAKYRFLGHGFMTCKLDWVLLRGCRAVSRRMGNHDYSASDHKWLLVEVEVEVALGG
ncbi:Nuclear speckle splicing regulatory protein 1 [Pleodorina starrii]|uniref:Nuclear speckle splicing regulatory protein 1 n=1 Tax=Pleodorina starrii TaxID=330485 RepID=A0A9W6BWF4_9CHLO|nr:Nuclear speckle splicing regulatory protein 1 [Pleodorina starrii]